MSLCIPYMASANFIDVDETNPNQKAIEWLQEKNITPEKTTKFFPEKTITKNELYQLAWRAAGYMPSETIKGSMPFSDVESNSAFAPYIKKSVETGAIKGGGIFGGGRKISRIDALKTLFNIMGIGITRVYQKEDFPFSDVRANSVYAPIVKTALEFKIMDGEETFRPKENITRGEVAEDIYRISTLNPSSQNQSPQQIQIIQVQPEETTSGESTFTKNKNFKILTDVWNKIHEKYVGKEPVDDKKLVYGAISGMVNKLNDKFTVFQEPVTAKGFSEALSGEFDGIGVSIDIVDGKIQVVSPIQGTPASKAGLKSKDTILEVDKKNVSGLSLNEVSSLIKGPTGSETNLLIERGGKKITFAITREHIKLDAVVGEMKGTTAYITIRSFTESSGIDFAEQVKKLMVKNPKSFIIDLRDNPGGYLDASLQMLDLLVVPKTRIASIKFSKRDNAEIFFQESNSLPGRAELSATDPEVIFYSIGTGELANYSIKILINGGSASASEIMAASLRENDRATLIGEKSYGKGTVQEITDYPDGSLFKETIGHWQTPLEHNLTENPIIPDIEIKQNEKTKKDEVLDYALGN